MQRLVILVLLAFCGATAVADEHPQRSVNVAGSGAATATPDGAVVTISIIERAKDVKAAQERAATVTNAVLKLTDRLKIKRRDVDTTGANINPEYRYDRDKQEQVFVGYVVQRTMSVRIKELDDLGALIEGAVDAGVNQVSSPQLTSTEQDEAYREALREAAQDARRNAALLAEEMGAALGKVISINAHNNRPQPRANVRALAAADSAESSYNAGDLTFTATVNASFELVDP